MSWLWGSSESTSEGNTTTSDDTLNPLPGTDTTKTYDFTRNSTFELDDDDEDFGDYNATTSDSDFLDMSSLSSSSSIAPRLDFNNLDGINPGAIGLGGGGYGGGYLGDSDFFEVRRRGFGEQLTYLAGLSYLSGAAIGGSRGLVGALSSSRGKSFKLRLNAVLNGMGKRGALLANSMGILALLFATSEYALFNATREDDAVNYAVAGGVAGAVFKSTKGLRAAGLWGAAGAAVGLGAVYASRQGVYGREVQGLL